MSSLKNNNGCLLQMCSEGIQPTTPDVVLVTSGSHLIVGLLDDWEWKGRDTDGIRAVSMGAVYEDVLGAMNDEGCAGAVNDRGCVVTPLRLC